jgi:heme o synthase
LTNKLLLFFQLTKPIISVSVALSALTGFLLYQGFFAVDWLWLVSGLFLLSSGSAAINHIQEAEMDILMERTRKRPIPGGLVKPYQAGVFAIILILSGIILLLQLSTYLPVMLGMTNIVLYNLIYTPLKKVTPFAVFPGALVGAIPPVIGWTAAGGSITHPHALLLAFLFFVGQIPHFWLILLKHAGDYEKAGFPSLSKIFTVKQLVRLTLVWITATALAAIMLVVFGILQSVAGSVVVLVCAIALIIYFLTQKINVRESFTPSKSFMVLNIFYLIIIATLIADSLLAVQ